MKQSRINARIEWFQSMSDAPWTATQVRACVLLITGALLLGASPILVRLSELGPLTTAFYRAALAVPLLVALLAIETRRNRTTVQHTPLSRRDWALMAAAGVFFAGDLAFWHLAILHTSVANATLFATLAPIWVTLGLFVLFKARFAPRFLVGIALSVIGAGLLVADSIGLKPDNLTGDLYGVVTGMFLGAYLIAVGRSRSRVSTVQIMAYSTIVTALVLLVPAVLLEDAWVPMTAAGWGVLVGLAFGVHALGQGLIAYAMAHLPTGFSSATMLIEAVLAALLAWVLFAEALGPLQVAGGAAVIAGLVMARRGERVPA